MNTPPIDENLIRETLRQVIDPEIGCNIMDLGLIYDIVIHGNHVLVRMTLTTPGCPMHEMIANGVQMALLNLDGVDDAEVELAWDPPWHPDMMTDFARARVGLAPH